MITIDDFKKLDIRLGTITEAAKIPEADRLVRLLIDMGSEVRQVVSGIAAHYPDPSVLVGTQVPVLANLEPRMIKGYESKGMVLYAIETDTEGKERLTTMSPAAALANGSIVR